MKAPHRLADVRVSYQGQTVNGANVDYHFRVENIAIETAYNVALGNKISAPHHQSVGHAPERLQRHHRVADDGPVPDMTVSATRSPTITATARP